MVIPEAVVQEEEETADHNSRREGFTPESHGMDESDVSTAKTKDDAIIYKGSSQITTESSEYSNNCPS
jgi:hypothetical protein